MVCQAPNSRASSPPSAYPVPAAWTAPISRDRAPVGRHRGDGGAARARNDVIALHSGYPDRELLPERLVRAAFTRAARSDATVSRPPAAGLPEPQAWFATELGSVTSPGVMPPHAWKQCPGEG
jgi:hypothetical protein